jgi:hypothetical protein
MSHLADGLPPGIRGIAVTYPGKSPHSSKKNISKISEIGKHARRLLLHCLSRFLERYEVFDITFWSSDDLHFLISKTLLHHCIDFAKSNFLQSRHLTEYLEQIGNGGVYRPSLKPVTLHFVGVEVNEVMNNPANNGLWHA